MKKLTYAIIAFLAFVCIPLCAQTAEKKPTVVIVPFETSGGVSQEEYDIMMNIFDAEYASFDGLEVVDRGLLPALKAELNFSDSDWRDSRKTALLGQALNVQQIVRGQIRLYNGIVFFTVQVQNLNTLAVLASVNVQSESLTELFGKIPMLCKDLAHEACGSSN
ncbi:MAG: hypothetical protein K2J68_02075 [Treponemataceae bacterium]|nr:hypothetical protein [Treponemataceae bacterium]